MKRLKPQKQLILTVLISDFMLLKRSYDGYECSVGITVIFSSSCAARVVHNTRARRKDNVRAIDLREQCQNKFNLHICSNS